MRYRQVTWNLPQSLYQELTTQVERYRKFGVHPHISEMEYALAALARGLQANDRELTQMSAPHIVLPTSANVPPPPRRPR